MYVDDLWAFTSHVGRNTKVLTQVLLLARVVGHLLLGYDGWSKKKAIADGLFSSMHKRTGMDFILRAQPEPNVFFTMDRFQKNIALCKQAATLMENGAEEFEIGFVQKIHGNQCWLFKVYQSLTEFVSGWRRCMQEENTAASEPSFKVSPAQLGESKRKTAWKHALDNSMPLQCLECIAEVKPISGEGSGEDAVPLSAITRQGHGALDATQCHGIVAGRICGDASGLAWSILNPDAMEAAVIPMPSRIKTA